jgi:hypothetical protein
VRSEAKLIASSNKVDGSDLTLSNSNITVGTSRYSRRCRSRLRSRFR